MSRVKIQKSIKFRVEQLRRSTQFGRGADKDIYVTILDSSVTIQHKVTYFGYLFSFILALVPVVLFVFSGESSLTFIIVTSLFWWVVFRNMIAMPFTFEKISEFNLEHWRVKSRNANRLVTSAKIKLGPNICSSPVEFRFSEIERAFIKGVWGSHGVLYTELYISRGNKNYLLGCFNDEQYAKDIVRFITEIMKLKPWEAVKVPPNKNVNKDPQDDV